MNIIIAIVIFSIIILIHELGHFLLAKKSGICVVEFSLGMGPRLFKFQKGETIYSLKLFPFGGSCMMLGEDEDSDDERAFGKKSVWARISVIFAGPVFNFIMAFLFAIIIISIAGYDKAEVSGLMEGYPAEEAGMQVGDKIVKMGKDTIHVSREISLYLAMHEGEKIDVTYKRDGVKKTVTIEPRFDEETDRYYVGLQGLGLREKGNILQILQYSVYEIRYQISMTVKSIGMLVSGKVSVKDLSGPLGIVNVIGDTYKESKSQGVLSIFLNMMNMVILLSANLGVMNLLPIPALDGGRLIFLIIEAVRRKKIPASVEGTIHFVGFMLLMALMIFVLFNDIHRIFIK